jgi:hypothetical protein
MQIAQGVAIGSTAVLSITSSVLAVAHLMSFTPAFMHAELACDIPIFLLSCGIMILSCMLNYSNDSLSIFSGTGLLGGLLASCFLIVSEANTLNLANTSGDITTLVMTGIMVCGPIMINCKIR